ncbi:MAG: hypothetical protein IT168_30870 [Bryobacterales bacterium]|nr:hypothetical protein [Bryobacterales bacterium]
MTPSDLLGIVSRFVHVTSAIVLLGGAIFARTVRQANLMRKFGGLAVTAAVAIVLSGLYNLLTKVNTPKPYHMVFGIKFLLALHVLAVGVMAAKANVDEQKRQRWLTSVSISGLAIALLSAYLRWLSR